MYGGLNKQDITAINAKIPANASSSNQLVTAADNNFKYTNLGDVIVDADTLTTPGIYSVRNKSPLTQNLPSSILQDAWCVIYVTNVDNNLNFVQQKCIDWNGNEWNRYSQTGTWFSWVGVQKEDTAVQWIGSAGNMTLAQIYNTFSKQNTKMYKGFLDWQDTRVPLYGQGPNTVEITCYDWNLIATTVTGKSFYYDANADSWIENTPIATVTAQIQTDVNGNIALYAVLPASANVEIISVRGTDLDSDFTYLPGRNYNGDWWCQLFSWAGVKLTGVHTFNIAIKYRRLA